jgi:hypothetical protein
MPAQHGTTLNFPGLKGRQVAQGTHPLFDLVGASQFTSDNADANIDRVVAHFANQNKMFGWAIGPLSTPTDLAARLEKKGLKKIAEFAGMVRNDLNHTISVNPKLTVRPATDADADDVAYLYEHGYPLPREFMPAFMDMLPLIKGTNYLAFLEGVDRPISAATMFTYPGQPILVLQGAATLEAYRGNGAYTALVASRLDAGRAQGLEVAILQADRTTSAPICAKLGFGEICSWDLWAWGVEDGAH